MEDSLYLLKNELNKQLAIIIGATFDDFLQTQVNNDKMFSNEVKLALKHKITFYKQQVESGSSNASLSESICKSILQNLSFI